MICAAPIGSGVHISKSIARFFEKFTGFLSGERRRKRVKAELIAKYREFDAYDLDEVVTPAFEIKTPRLLPSEPPGGITYRFGPSGYLSKNRNADYCVIHTQWKNVANYCHWTFCELPLLHLALASTAKYVVIPDALQDYTQPFQK